MQIIEEIKYQYKKIRDRFVFKRLFIQKRPWGKNNTSNTILVIRIDAIGDCIIWLDQAKEYRKAYPNHKLILLHNLLWTEIAGRLTWFDECIPFDRGKIGNFNYYKSLLTIINRYTYEKVYSPVYSRDIITVDWLVHNINAKEKIGYQGDYQNNHKLLENNLFYRQIADKYNLKTITDKWYSTLVENDSRYEMELQRNAHFIRQTINANFCCSLPTIPFEIPKSQLIPKTEYAILFLGASSLNKTWPINNFINITQELTFQTIVLCGSCAEKKLAQNYISLYNGDKTIIDLMGKTSLLELICIISNASLVITNDTSASHISVATRTPSICLLGGGHYGRFHPYRVDKITEEEKKYLPTVITAHNKTCFSCNWTCTYPLQNERCKCINEIQVDDVINAIKSKNEIQQ